MLTQLQSLNLQGTEDDGCPPGATQVEMDATDLTLLLSGIELTSVKRRPRYVPDVASGRILDAVGS